MTNTKITITNKIGGGRATAGERAIGRRRAIDDSGNGRPGDGGGERSAARSTERAGGGGRE